MKISPPVLTFDHTPEAIDSLCRQAQGRLQTGVEAITRTAPAEATFRNTVLALERASTQFSNEINAPLFLKYVSTDEKVRAAADRSETAVQQMIVDIFAREDLFEVIKAAAAKEQSLDKADALLMEEYLSLFRRNGLDLPAEKRSEYVEKKKRLVAIEAEYSKRLVEWDDALELELEELNGLPEAFIHSLPKTTEGKYRVTLSYPHYNPFIENAKSSAARAKLEMKYLCRGGERNRELLEQALQVRDELAKLLGFRSHAHFVLDRRMAKTPERVMEFLSRLKTRLIPMGKKNVEELTALKRSETGDPKAKEVQSHEWRYYDNLLRKRKYSVDTQAIKEYFPLPTVMAGMFALCEELFGVEFRREDGPKWHSSVERYRVSRKGTTIAIFFTDLFPRDGKYSHAAAFTLLSGHVKGGESYQAPASAIVGNFNPPTATAPSLLEHGEVETLFHEFGHILHQLLTRARYGTFAGTSVKTDFVEAPSQMMENWVWDKTALQRLSGHYRDPSKKLPDADIENLLRAKLLNAGIRYLRQLSFAEIDMLYHSGGPCDSSEIYQRCSRETMLIPIPEGAQPQASFGHLMGGYDAGYYSYLWSEVYAQDLFTRFETEGLFNPETGEAYRKWILEPGGEEDPFKLLRGFLGREPNETAFLRSLGM